MARLTVEDCLSHVDNRFDLVLLASKRARQISLGSQPLLEQENDKPTVLALREIADGLMTQEVFEAIEAKESAVEEELSPFGDFGLPGEAPFGAGPLADDALAEGVPGGEPAAQPEPTPAEDTPPEDREPPDEQ